MFSFSKIALYFTLGAAAFAAAAPLSNSANVKDSVAARCDTCGSSDGGVAVAVGAQVSLDVVIDTLTKTVTPICAELNAHTVDTITVDIVTKKTAELTVALGVAIKGVKALIGVSADVALGVKLDIALCITLLAKVVVQIFVCLGFVLSLCVKININTCKPLLVAVGKLCIDLLVNVVVVVKGLDGVLGLVLNLLISLLGGCFNAVIALGLQAELGACLGITI